MNSSNTNPSGSTPDITPPEPPQMTWEDLALANKMTILAALVDLGITLVVVSFDGYGDSGQIEDVKAYQGEVEVELPVRSLDVFAIYDGLWSELKHSPETCSLAQAIEGLTYAALSHWEGGWENNNGAFGEFRIEVADSVARLEFNARITDIDYSQYSV